MTEARRLLMGIWTPLACRAGLVLGMCLAGAAAAETIVDAHYEDPTDRYAHGVLGDAIEWGTLAITTEDWSHRVTHRIRLPQNRVFEDVAPRLADLDGQGGPEVVVVESEAATGAQLAIYNETGKIAATPHIGQSFRWLAPIGAADLDGDGFVEIAYIDRPHLAKTLRVWRYKDGALDPVAHLPGLTNHRIGEPDIGGGLRDCGNGPEMITASANWRDVMVTRLEGGSLSTKRLGPHRGRADLNAALNCR